MAKKKKNISVPKDTNLVLTNAQWLALKGILENFTDDNDAPFLDHYGSQVLEMMGGHDDLDLNFEKYNEYNDFYKNERESCGACQKSFEMKDLTLVDKDNEEYLCSKCLKELE